jgi:hypothetical protein
LVLWPDDPNFELQTRIKMLISDIIPVHSQYMDRVSAGDDKAENVPISPKKQGAYSGLTPKLHAIHDRSSDKRTTCKIFAELFKMGYSRQAIDLLHEYGVVAARYGLAAKYARVDLESTGGFVAIGHREFVPGFGTRNGIDWSQHLPQDQYHIDSSNRVEVKTVVTAIRGAGHAGGDGLLHVLLQPGVPIAAFDTTLVKSLVRYKCDQFGHRAFIFEATIFVAMLGSFALLTQVISQHGDAALAASVGPSRAWGGVLLAAAAGLLFHVIRLSWNLVSGGHLCFLYCRRLLATAVLLAPVAGAAALLGFGLQPDDGLSAFWGTPSLTASAITVLVAVTARGIATESQEFLAQSEQLKRMDYFANMWNV